jgi:catechol 2,3-dioxygenase-like lactoylglutathione lyase family enzyme
MSETFWHVGILVADMDAAIQRFSGALGVRFGPPATAKVPDLREGPPKKTTELRVAMSEDGPPYFELIEQAGTGLFGSGEPEGFHHIGIWRPDNEAQEQVLAAAGVGVEARSYLFGGCLQALFSRGEDLHGVRVEFTNEQNRARIEKFIATGELDD